MQSTLKMLTKLAAISFLFPAVARSFPPLLVQESPLRGVVKVPVVLGVMSACPDAILCESVFDKVLKEVNDKVDLSLSFIARLNASEPTWGVRCMHGPNECAGNVQELCAAKYAPSVWWEFVQCENYEGRSRIGLPEVALKCASIAGFDWKSSRVGACAGLDGSGKGEEGVALLKQSVISSENLGITTSCTVMINGRQVCIHDGVWTACEDGHDVQDFVRQINKAYDQLNSE